MLSSTLPTTSASFAPRPRRSRQPGISPQASTPRFGGGPLPVPASYQRAGIDRIFGWLSANRTREMLVEDLIGFGLLRTTMDLLRGYFYGDGKLNTSMARERTIREVGSILTDNVSSGVAALGLGYVLDKKLGAYSNRFSSFESLECFRSLLTSSPDRAGLMRALAERFDDATTRPDTRQAIARALSDTPLTQDDLASRISRLLQQPGFDWSLAGKRVNGQALLSDLAELDQQVMKRLSDGVGAGVEAGAGEWVQAARPLVEKTLLAKRVKLSCLSVGIVSTLAIPYINHWVTRRMDGSEAYPGEPDFKKTRPNPVIAPAAAASTARFGATTLRQPNAFQRFQPAVANAATTAAANNGGWQRHLFPYLADSVRDRRYGPVALSAVPLVFASGLFDTVNRRFNNPFQKGFLKLLRNTYDFGKGFPFTTQQQMATMFAFLIFSRLTTARSENEFRERTIDSFLGWFLWILGTPIIKKNVARLLQARTGSELLKQSGKKLVLKSRDEIDQLLTGALRSKTLRQFDRIGSVSVLASMILMGIVEPYIAIQWTKRNAARKAATPPSTPS